MPKLWERQEHGRPTSRVPKLRLLVIEDASKQPKTGTISTRMTDKRLRERLLNDVRIVFAKRAASRRSKASQKAVWRCSPITLEQVTLALQNLLVCKWHLQMQCQPLIGEVVDLSISTSAVVEMTGGAIAVQLHWT